MKLFDFSEKKSGKSSYNQSGFVWDSDNYVPVIRASICTGEKVAGFKDTRTNKFIECDLIQNNKDLEAFAKKYRLSPSQIKTEW